MVESGVVEDSGVLTFFLILTPWVTMVSWPLEAGEASCSGPHHCSWAGACCQASPEVKWLHNHTPQSSIYQVIIVSVCTCSDRLWRRSWENWNCSNVCLRVSVQCCLSCGRESLLCPVSCIRKVHRRLFSWHRGRGITYYLSSFFVLPLHPNLHVQHWCCLRLCHDVVSCEVCGGNTWELPSSWLRH